MPARGIRKKILDSAYIKKEAMVARSGKDLVLITESRKILDSTTLFLI